MAIDYFDKKQFEDALPKHKVTGVLLWESLGVIDGEFCYTVKPFNSKPYIIYIRSSVHSNGLSADCGDDSIRAWIINEKTEQVIGNKSQRWVDRRKGWQDRLLKMLRLLATRIQQIVPCVCCTKDVVPFTCKQGANKGRVFVKCMNKSCSNPMFRWLDDEK